MSYSLHIWRFVDGEPVPMDETAIRAVLGPVTVGGIPNTGLPEDWGDLEAEDGGEATVYGGAQELMFTHCSPGRILDLIAELARRTGAAVMPDDCPMVVTSEADRRHLPEAFRAEAIVVAPEALTGRTLQLLIAPQPEPASAPPSPPTRT
ncbi:hypothetical protein [Streptomyces sp. SID13726]|uniref:hypothetical protein n=1 Tax=Streptomyces sp. SID13726 TaxID=2706058 RepID=UPI0013BD9686|nr:hypothetical protein [Streptomyces sp. SID13726]NEA99950.1 hypothetical protein [Streptomyces sp. SID13726]